MVTVFDAALTIIARHRVHHVFFARPGEHGSWRCGGCDWLGTTRSDADVHVATMIDEEVE